MIIYNVVNIFSMKNYKYSRKLRVGVNWYPGVNWSTTTTQPHFDNAPITKSVFDWVLQFIISRSRLIHRLTMFIKRKDVNNNALSTKHNKWLQ